MNNVILVGMPCSGKTTVGKVLAERKKAEYIDTDQYIIANASKSIEQIFSDHGEEHFRQMERSVILDIIAKLENSVVSTGGGMPVKSNNMELLKKYGTVIYLKTTIKNLSDRLDRKNRPLFKDPDAIKTLENLLNSRSSIYEKADIIIECNDDTPDEICEKIIMSINSINTHF
ncbi:shikimate kinase [Clostridium fungisolvens]|uniref:Shikimate kinase n=1 Tax=Clostridium fungisolvens TaxID=1604897 RepID=A0A6V8SPC1_9CLOT|nr:shikimate kinase [Clostridium fungisolvens]GFP76713.1 Shikimate kinase [Clostridium fungisolvens]